MQAYEGLSKFSLKWEMSEQGGGLAERNKEENSRSKRLCDFYRATMLQTLSWLQRLQRIPEKEKDETAS